MAFFVSFGVFTVVFFHGTRLSVSVRCGYIPVGIGVGGKALVFMAW